MTEWNEALEKKILKKSRFVLTVRILRILMIGVLMYGAYMIALAFITDGMQVAEENDYYTKLALDWTVPNIRGANGFEEEEVSALGTSQLSYPLVRKVGKAEVVVGEAKVRKSLFNSYSTIEYQTPFRDELQQTAFYYPEDPRNGNSLDAPAHPAVWSTLDKLHEGTVAEVAFSTDSFMTPEELVTQLAPYDIDILWMPLHTGEFEEFTPGSWGNGGEDLSVNTVFGLTGGQSASDDFQSFSVIHRLDSETLQDSQDMMMDNIETLLEKKSASYYEGFLGLDYLGERHDYIEENGFTVYGAVVTGPVKELLKLEDEAMVTGEHLGQVELWNWESPTPY
ncbi:anti-sigma factor [Planococcus sp. CP5-4]|uniref:anti-sigma factor n=1 Tax=unclassified Planococcus (in: firmicutes) TaxID=2662419 RepID=UPI001C21F669|nr:MULTISPECIES: anti-sigma factor [unclassified Planococcus (in: firmicutes)]MBU9675079.1 anti-sigma factor [Planococcus sp. CP5-4_YE]MBV0910168.1 anti-sigma factor [Planococcus sp. CP5-4_UN]MBW6064625.1 anti-sigma factor [Planococcus sp. CP5-4]